MTEGLHLYFADFLKIAALHLLAVASPGPDFAMVLKQSVSRGRRSAIWTSAGIGAAILLHTAYSLLGIGLVLKSSAVAFSFMKFAAAGYLIWLGLKSLLAKGPPLDPASVIETQLAPSRPGAAFLTGFATNALNPKATIFFLSVFSAFAERPPLVLASYGVWMAFATAAWFSIVSLFFTVERVRARFVRLGRGFERVMGGLLIALGVRLALASAK
jgi:threonine/homoserine/homoserine lactone efflux protein